MLTAYLSRIPLRSLIYIFIFLGFGLPMKAQQTLPPGVDSVVVVFKTTPSYTNVEKAPLKYNKAFAMSFQMDDALSGVYDQVFPVFQGTKGHNGLFYTDGCGKDFNFKMSSAIFIFAANGQDILDPNDPWHDNTKLTWPKVDSLYKYHWGIENHGLFDNPDVSSPDIIHYAFNRTQSYVSRMISDSLKVRSFVIPNNVINFVNYLSAHHYHAAINQGQDSKWIGYGDNLGFDVTSDTINWLKPVLLNRLFWYDSFTKIADSLYAASKRSVHRWVLSGMHQLPGSFLSDMKSIYQKYGAPGMDNILITTDDEMLDYLAVKQATQLHTSLSGNKLVVTFTGNIPTNRKYYVLSLNVQSDAAIEKILVYHAKKYDYSGVGKDTALINVSWDGQVYKTPEMLADSFTQQAVNKKSQWDALVAMDYVLQMNQGDQRVKLQKELCGLDQTGWKLQYDDGFCALVDLGPDTTICSGDSVTLKGPENMASYQWKTVDSVLGSRDAVVVSPETTTQYFLTVSNAKGKTETDSMRVIVLPTPVVDLGKDTVLFSVDTLHFNGGNNTANSYLWSTGDTTSSLLILPQWDSTYSLSLTVTGQNGCQTQDSIRVILPPKDSVPEINVLKDTLLSCGGSEVKVEVIFNTKLIVWSQQNQYDTTARSYRYFSPEQSEKVFVRSCNSYGCSQPDSVYLKALKKPDITITQDTSLCFGDSIFLQASGGNHIQWSEYNKPVSKDSMILVGPERNTVFNVSLWNDTACVAKDSVVVHVNPLPSTRILFGNNRICVGSNALLTASGADRYLWQPDSDTSVEKQIVVHDTIKVMLVGWSKFGCAFSDSVVLFPLTVPHTKILFDTNRVCRGSYVHLSASGADEYFWSPLQDTSMNQTIQVKDTLQVKVTGTGSSGCSATDSLNLYAMPVPETKILYDSNRICRGDQITLTASGADHYDWSSKDTSTSISYVVNDTSTIFLKGSNNYGCALTDSVSVYALPVPSATISGLLSYYCENALPDTLGGAPSGGVFSGAGMYNDVFFPADAGPGSHKIFYTFTTDQGCVAKTNSVTVVSDSIPVINLTPKDTTLRSGEHIQYDARPGFSNYFWTTGDTTRTAIVFYSDQLPDNDTVRVVGLVNNCVSIGEAVLHMGKTTGITPYPVKLLPVYPNPNHGKFTVKVGVLTSSFIARLLNIRGHVLEKKIYNLRKANSKITFDFSYLHKGIYFLVIQNAHRTAVAKVIIQ